MKSVKAQKITYQFLFILLLLVAFVGCKSKRDIITTGGSLKQKTEKQLFADVLDEQLSYKTITAKVSLEFSGESLSGMKVNSQLKMIKDEAIQLSLRAPFINTEVFRVNITPTTISVVDRLSKIYAQESIEGLGAGKNILFNFENLQALFTDQLFYPGKKTLSKNNFNLYRIKEQDDMFYLSVDNIKNADLFFTVDASDKVISANIVTKDENYGVLWNYSNFVKEKNNKLYPTLMEADVKLKTKQVKLKMSLSNIEFDKEVKVETEMPKNYTKVSLLDLMKKYVQ